MRLRVSLALAALLIAAGVLSPLLITSATRAQTRLAVVTTVAPITSIALNVGGNRIKLTQLVPDGTDSHTFEPTPSDARAVAQANLILVNGLHLEESTIALARANMRADARLLQLGDDTVDRSAWVFDFSFPESNGDPNPHLWMNPLYGLRYAELIRDELAELDPANAAYYADNTARFLARGQQLDEAMMTAIQTIPPRHRKLLTFHDSFAYFAPRYGMSVIGAIQPADFSEPSPQEVAALIEQIRAEDVPAIFGSEVFPSRVLEQIGREAGVRYVDKLRDDDLPGAADAPEHTYFGMLREDVATMAEALGGSPAAVLAVDPSNTFQP